MCPSFRPAALLETFADRAAPIFLLSLGLVAAVGNLLLVVA